MEADQAASDSVHRPLMDEVTFTQNFREKMLRETHLCYEVQAFEDDSQGPVKEFKGFLRNQQYYHAELCFLDLIRSRKLDKMKRCTITCFISWSPCPDCAEKLVAFLKENSHVSLSIFAARIYTVNKGYEAGLRALQAARAKIAIMTSKEIKYCWETFVDNKGYEFQPEDNNLQNFRHSESQELEKILKEH